ncbi:uncharacterized protein MONOS_5480 [Monocercomonoides exilis]|uniref:uncharacterized protein n=1 Tax=Monocercomonoides exilis TaxID=2049356 RepID=UPI00355A3B08|nr:hypothetical protein MONOS_5480 [Monocercomonoides exilis]|eukprot:MONOS_5480.1-p1 / transcript=MONOS_5480.1 / gene=MONOS_5480 / organism=Monocercomonoides_exilis_PA203 / gene_product=unspecified product / transcript_product=unspecified product / location=Mono_scaffold00160:21773-33178(-) / protein_length=3801 / sequence_SO=supercontig / SO=protein_coding / is_pseudo=false
MVVVLSGIFYCAWIISAGCVCNNFRSDRADLAEKSAKERELDYSEGTWPEKAQNNKIGDGNLYDTYVEGKEGGARETEIQERIMKKYTKQWNEGSGEIRKVQKWSFCDEWKMRGKERMCDGSGVEGSVVVVNSSMKLNLLGLMERGGKSVLRASDGCFVEVSGCVVGVERETSPFDFCGSCGLFTNISLRSFSTGFLQSFPSLFSSKALEGEISEKCHISVCSSHFSSFCVSSAPFISSHFVCLSQLEFFNISTNPSKTRQLGEGLSQTSFLMSGCEFSSVWDVYDGGIVPSLNSPSSSLAASNTSFVRCYRSQNVEVNGSEGNPSKPVRQQITDNGENSFTWCVWNGSNTTGTSFTVSDGVSSGGAINMYSLSSGTLSVKLCLFNDCYASYAGGGIMCCEISSIKIENNSFNSCTTKYNDGGGIYVGSITSCVRISGCEFQKCKASSRGGGLCLNNFNVSGSSCIETENGKGESASVFECSFTSCSLTNSFGGGMFFANVPAAFKMRSLQFLSCSAVSWGGGLDLEPYQSTTPSNNLYCYFLFFHDCRCTDSTPFGHDVCLKDYYNLFSSNNPFQESYTTNNDERRLCYAYYLNDWYYQRTEKKNWLKEGKLLFVGGNGNDLNELCGMNETMPCKTIGYCVNKCNNLISLGISVLVGRHVSEGETISVGEKKISVVGRGKTVSVIGTSALSTSSTMLFSISSGQLEVGHVGIDHNATRSPSPSVFVVSLGSGTLSLEDVVIDSSTSGGSGMTKCVFEVALKQLKTIDVEIKNMKMNQPLFAEPLSAESSSGESVLCNLTIRNVNRTGGDGVAMSKSVKAGEIFVVWNTTMEGCKCMGGSGGGIMIDLSAGAKMRIGSWSTFFGGTVKYNGCKSSGYGGGVMLYLADNSFDFSITSVRFVDCAATLGGKNLFVEAQDLSAVINRTSIGFEPVIEVNEADLNELCGRERNQGDMIVPLVVLLRTFSSPAYVSGREQGSEFRLCGYEDYPCKTIGEASEYRYPSSKRNVRLTSTFSFVEEVKLNEQSYEIDSSNKDVGLKVGGTGTKTQEALVMNSVSSTLTGILFELGESIGERSSFVHSSGGTLRFADCGIKMGNEVDAVNYEFASASGGTLSISDFSMAHVKFGMKAFIVINGNGGASIEDSLLENVETTNMKGLIDYSSSSSSLTIVNVTAQECVMGGKGLICDENGKKLGMRNCTIMKMNSLEGNGSIVSGEAGNGCAVEVNEVVIEGCGTLKGCGGGMSVILKGTGEMRLGKSGVVTSFEKCSAGNEGSVGGYGGGVLLRCEEGGSNFVMSELIFGRGEGANTAAHGGNNVFVEGANLPQLVNNVSFDFSFEIEGEGFNIEDLMGAENGNELRLIPVVVFFREKPSVGYVNRGNGGIDYHKCGYADFACSTLTYAGTNVFGTSPATLKLVDRSSVIDEMTLNIQQMNIDGDIPKAKIRIVEGGEGEEGNEFLIKSEQAISFSSLAFSISTFARSGKECVFLCSANTLRFEECSFGAESQEIGVGLICGKGGKVELTNCEFENIRMTKSGMVTFDGVGVGGLIDEVIVRNVTREYEGRSLFELRNGGDIEIKNTTMNESRFENGNEIEIGEGINAKIWNCTFKSIQRGSGNGGVLNGRVGSGKCMDINKCVFEECKCNSVSAIGGGIVMIVGDGGNLLFDENKINGCRVAERSGKGGGSHLTFETTNIEYSMKNDTFANNVAKTGEDVYLVCGSPWTMLLPELWEGTATRVTAENKMWVLESSEPRKEDSLINYLFPRLRSNLFVSNIGNELSSCGAKENPCSSVDIGFDRLNDEIERIMLVGAASVSKTINRGGKGLTIKGNEETRELVVEEGGKFELTEGDGQTHLTLSLLQISLPCSSSASASGDESIVEVRIGQCFILDCMFSGGEGNSNVNECWKWIVIGNGGVIRIERTEMNGITFEGCGIARFGGGNVIFENCSLDGIETSGGGVIMGNGGSEVTLRNMTALGCVVGAGSLITSNGGSSLRVDGESRFEDIETESVSGGCLKSEMKLNDLLEMGSSSILRCSANGNGGRGGGIYLNLSDDCVNNFSLSTLIFKDNVAAEGRDLFISCKKLNETVTKERFGFEYKYENGEGEGEGQAVDMKGIDRAHFVESVDLGLFLVEMKGMEVCVSREGYDTLGCGSDGYPCESMWSGIRHNDMNGGEGERKVKVRDEGAIEDIYSFTDALAIDGCVNEGDEIKHKPVHFEGTIKGNSESSSVISSTVSLSLLSLMLQIPNQFDPNMDSLISSSGVLKLESCLFEIRSLTAVQYSLITTTSGSCILKGCSFVDSSFTISPLVMASSVLLENSNFSNIENKGSEEGGAAKVTLQGNEKLDIKSTNASSCSLLKNNGKGGFLYLDCQNYLNENPFLFDVDVTFENNNATIGKNLFILGRDFNASVTNDSFKFDYSSMINDKTLFVGSDDFHQEKDLFMFLVPYSSIEILISSEGFDVARCGSEEEPCFTMWKGMENMKKENGNKTIQIEESTIIRDSFNMSNYQIKKSEKMGEENVKAILNFEKAIGSQLEYFMVNDVHLELMNIQLQLTSGFDNSAKSIISNKGGDLVILECSFHSEAGVNNGFDCVFVDVIGGSVEVNDFSMESCNIGNSIFNIHDSGVDCHFVNVHVKSLNESGGCILAIKKFESGLEINEGSEGGIVLQIDKSSFSGVKRSDNGVSILESKSEKKICLVVSESNITEDKAESSEKGGVIFFTLGASGSMKMVDSTISQCSCTNGKGGGVYLATEETGFLNFTFMGMKFSANAANVGNDIFIECYDITLQINERQFQFDLREGHYSRINAIYGRDECDYPNDIDLIGFVTIHQSDTIIVGSVNGSDEKQCGTNALPCDSIDYGLMHMTSDFMSLMFIVEESVICEEISLKEMSLSSKSRGLCEVEVKSEIKRTRETLVTTNGAVSLSRVNFEFDSNFISHHKSLISPEEGILEIVNCSFGSKLFEDGFNVEFTNIPFHLIFMKKGELQLDGCLISNLILHESALYLSSPLSSVIDSLTICNSTISRSLIEIIECGQLNIDRLLAENISVEGNEDSLISCLAMKKTMQLANCTIGGVSSQTTKGKLMKAENSLDVKMDNCIFDGSSNKRNEQYLNEEEEICRWNGSLVEIVKSSVMRKVSTITNSPEGGITMRGGNVIIEKGEFIDNNPSIEKYPSLRRNIICSDSGTLNVRSLKGGDGWERNTSLWMLNEGCSFEGIASERDPSFFIPVLDNVDAKEETDRMKLTFKGMLLIPCNLSFSVVKRKGEEKEIEHYDFDSNGFLSEREVEGRVAKDLISSCGDEIEVSVHVLFGNAESPSSTQSFILKNKSETEPKGNEKIVEGRKEGNYSWALIVCIAIVVILLITLIIFIVRWKKQKRRTKELEVIVEDTVKKDPKAFEMVTMEMSPEEQWRRAEREAEKKNDERMKKRVYDTNMQHSESSEHLLSESGSTEYILGRDSDKIPQWALEKEEEEEIRKRTPSPSISSTSTTDTSDTESTFVRREDLCPTTSSMSNLVDAMACSSPHEKLIVDLRDSLFMLLHGRNKTKEMAIGTVEERMATGAQILFWVGNVALHSFGEMEVPLESLDRLSPHIVLFSEHMVICVVMHSGSSSSEDSDSSSVSSLSVVSSSSNVSVMSERFTDSPPPSSAFEDEEGEKEYLRWRAPELLEGRKTHATKKSVVFSMGMMLWECVALAIPFGEYDAETAGEKVKHGERPGVWRDEWAAGEVVESMVRQKAGERATLVDVKRELFKHFPSRAVFVTMSDAIDCYGSGWCGSGYGRGESGSRSRSRSRSERGNENEKEKENKVG